MNIFLINLKNFAHEKAQSSDKADWKENFVWRASMYMIQGAIVNPRNNYRSAALYDNRSALNNSFAWFWHTAKQGFLCLWFWFVASFVPRGNLTLFLVCLQPHTSHKTRSAYKHLTLVWRTFRWMDVDLEKTKSSGLTPHTHPEQLSISISWGEFGEGWSDIVETPGLFPRPFLESVDPSGCLRSAAPEAFARGLHLANWQKNACRIQQITIANTAHNGPSSLLK